MTPEVSIHAALEIHEDTLAVVPGLGWRPTPSTVSRLNHHYHWQSSVNNGGLSVWILIVFLMWADVWKKLS